MHNFIAKIQGPCILAATHAPGELTVLLMHEQAVKMELHKLVEYLFGLSQVPLQTSEKFSCSN